MKFIFFILFLFYSQLQFANEHKQCGVLISELKSEALRLSLSSLPNDAYINICEDVEARSSLTSNMSLYFDNRKIDNREYVLALAIDLCNSLPPDYVPKIPPKELEQKEKDYEAGLSSGDPIYNPAPKNICLDQLRDHLFPPKEIKEQQKALWDYAVKKGRMSTHYVEIKYLKLYPFNNIKLDEFGSPASMLPQDINFENPTHYQAFKEHMEKMRPAIEAGIKPWEAMAYLGLEGSVEEKAVQQTAAQEKEKTQPAQEAVKPPAPIQAEKPASQFKPEYFYILGGLILLAALGFGFSRLRK